jgi:hypothetical protein
MQLVHAATKGHPKPRLSRGPARLRKNTKIGSISRITQQMSIAAKSKKGKSMIPVSRAGPKWNGVSGMVIQNLSKNQVAISLMTLIDELAYMTMLCMVFEKQISI